MVENSIAEHGNSRKSNIERYIIRMYFSFFTSNVLPLITRVIVCFQGSKLKILSDYTYNIKLSKYVHF